MEDSTNLSISNNNETLNNNLMGGNSSVEFEPIHDQPAKIKVIGVGGGGGNAVNHMYREGIHGVEFIVCNTDVKALESSPVPNKIVLGTLGAGNNPEHARKMALEHKDEILQSISDDTQMLFITAGMGGGTGTGAAPVVAELAKSIKLADELVPQILVVAIVTEPFEFEGPVRTQQAKKGIDELKKHVDAILVINNDNLRRLGDMDIDEAFSKADDVLLTAAKGIAEIITRGGKVNIDFRDVNTVMQKSGTALMGTGSGHGENRAMEAIENAATSVLLNDNDIRGAKNVLLYFSYAPNHKIKMDELYGITNYVKERTGHTANVIWGNGMDEDLDDELRITLIATGFEPLPGRTVINLEPLEEPKPNDEKKTNDTQEKQNTKDVHESPIDESGIHLVHRVATENKEDTPAKDETKQEPANNTDATKQEKDIFNNPSNDGPKRYFSLDAVPEPSEETENETTDETNSFESDEKQENNDHLNGIRVISREIIQNTPQQQPSTPKFNIQQTEAMEQTKPAENNTPNTNTYDVFGASSRVDIVAETTIAKPATQQQAHSERITQNQVAQALNPSESLDDIKARQRAERIRRMNDLLRHDPDGPRKVEEMSVSELSSEPIYEAPHSSESDAARTRVSANGGLSSSMDFLNGLPD